VMFGLGSPVTLHERTAFSPFLTDSDDWHCKVG